MPDTKYSKLSPAQKASRIRQSKEYNERNSEKVRARKKAHYEANKDRLKAKSREVALRDPEKTAAYQAAYRKKHKAKLLAYFSARYYQKDKRASLERHKIRDKARKKEDPNYRIGRQIRCRISAAIREQYGKKAFKTLELIGCTVAELRDHIEKQWLPGMSWENWALDGWHIDHIRPVTAYDLTNPEQQKECFLFLNLQPLWGPDNIRKGNKVTTAQTPAAESAQTEPTAPAAAPSSCDPHSR